MEHGQVAALARPTPAVTGSSAKSMATTTVNGCNQCLIVFDAIGSAAAAMPSSPAGGREGDVDPVVAGCVGAVRECAGAVPVHPVAPTGPVRQCMQGRLVRAGGEVVLVHGVVTGIGVVGGHICCVGRDGHWSAEVDLLPARGRLTRECGRS